MPKKWNNQLVSADYSVTRATLIVIAAFRPFFSIKGEAMGCVRLEDIKAAIQRLPAQEFRTLASWIADYEQERWDGEIEQDLQSGRLDKLIKSALDDIKNGEFKDM
jgi:hypothetical protein